MICDDHEITDDWNIDYAWVNSVYAKPAGRRAATNALLAYLVCQHWGNKPAEFDVGSTPEAETLALIRGAATSRAERGDSSGSASRRSHRPAGRRSTGAHVAGPDRAGAIRYDLTLGPDEGWPARIVLLDERTAREYPDQVGRGARISLAGLAVQLPPPATPADVTLVVAATPIVGTELIEHMLQPVDRAAGPRRRTVRRLRILVDRYREPPGRAGAARRAPSGRRTVR